MPNNSPKAAPSPQSSSNADFPGAGTVDEIKQRLNETLSQIEGQTREAPSRSLLYAVGVGYVLARLPVFGIVFSFVRLALMALKPAVLVYLGVLAYRRLTDGDES